MSAWTSRLAVVAIAVVATASATASTQRELRGDARDLTGDATRLQGQPRGLLGESRALDGGIRRLGGRVRKLVGGPIPPGRLRIFRTRIQFKFGKHGLTDWAKKRLRRLVMRLGERNVLTIRIAGHADAVGGSVYNIGLSFLRAARACELLLGEIVRGPGDCALTPYGEGRPTARNRRRDGTDNPRGRRLNRRAMVLVRARAR